MGVVDAHTASALCGGGAPRHGTAAPLFSVLDAAWQKLDEHANRVLHKGIGALDNALQADAAVAAEDSLDAEIKAVRSRIRSRSTWQPPSCTQAAPVANPPGHYPENKPE